MGKYCEQKKRAEKIHLLYNSLIGSQMFLSFGFVPFIRRKLALITPVTILNKNIKVLLTVGM
jgi:hypothetical protein